MARLRIPKQHSETLKLLTDLPAEGFESFAKTLAESTQVGQSNLEREIEAAVPSLGDSVAGLLNVLLAMEFIRESHSWTTDQMVEELKKAAGLPSKPSDRDELARRIGRCLGVPALRITAKALDLVSSQERRLLSTRILTEVRPIYPPNPADRPTNAVGIHVLELNVREANGEDRDYYVALDDNDLEELAVAVDKARTKMRSIESALHDAGIIVAKPYEETE